jgi:hypothetical protein
MTLPTRDDAAGWIGNRVNDTDGVEIGTCIKIYADDDTEALEWIGVALTGGANAVVPIGGSTESGGAVTVAFARDTVVAAPVAASVDFLSREDEVALYEHYKVPYTSAASTTTLPLGEDPQADVEESEAAAQTQAEQPKITPVIDTTPPESPPQAVPRQPWPTPEPLPTSRVVPALVVGGAVVAGAAAVRWLPIRRQPAPAAPAAKLSGALDRLPSVHLPLDRLSEIDVGGAARRAGWGAVHAAMIPSAYAALAAQRAAGVVREVAPRAGGAAAHAGHEALSEANRVVTTTAETASATVAGIAGAAESIYDTWRTTMGLLKTAVIFGGGYVLGTRAGREQYEVIKAKATEVAQSPKVQQATGKVKGAVSQKLPGGSRRTGYDTSASSFTTTAPTAVPPPVTRDTPATVAGIEDPVTPPRDITIDVTDDVPSASERRS